MESAQCKIDRYLTLYQDLTRAFQAYKPNRHLWFPAVRKALKHHYPHLTGSKDLDKPLAHWLVYETNEKPYTISFFLKELSEVSIEDLDEFIRKGFVNARSYDNEHFSPYFAHIEKLHDMKSDELQDQLYWSKIALIMEMDDCSLYDRMAYPQRFYSLYQKRPRL